MWVIKMPKYLYRRPNSPNWWFELTLPEDVRAKLNGGKKRIRRTTGTDSQKKASRIANVWADDLWSKIEQARSPDWEYHNIKASVAKYEADGLSADEIDDIAIDVLYDDPEKYDAYERATNKTVVLKDHLEGFLAWCAEKGNRPKSIELKRTMVRQFCDHFIRLEKVTEQAVMRWTSERKVKGATQKSMKTSCRDFYRYLGQEVLFKQLDMSVLDGFQTRAINSKPKVVISGESFRQALAATENKDGLMLLAHTGRRAVAMANLTCADVITSDGVRCFRIRIDKGHRPETNEPHVIPIHSKLSAIVDRLIKNSADGYLLPLDGTTIEARSSALQREVKKSGLITAHQFRTSVITMLHNSPKELPDKAIYYAVGHKHKVSKDVHMKTYFKGLKPSRLVPTTEEINWDDWEYDPQQYSSA